MLNTTGGGTAFYAHTTKSYYCTIYDQHTVWTCGLCQNNKSFNHGMKFLLLYIGHCFLFKFSHFVYSLLLCHILYMTHMCYMDFWWSFEDLSCLGNLLRDWHWAFLSFQVKLQWNLVTFCYHQTHFRTTHLCIWVPQHCLKWSSLLHKDMRRSSTNNSDYTVSKQHVLKT